MGEFHNMITASSVYDVIIIGSGPAGLNAAQEAASRGAHVLVIEQERLPGGACVQYGTIPSKTLRETALTLSAFQRRSGDVYRISHDAQLSICSLLQRLDEVVHAYQASAAACLDLPNIERSYGRASFLSADTLTIQSVMGASRVVSGSVIVIATGSRPRNPPHLSVDHENILDSDSVLSMSYLPQSLAVIGSGVIACEYASTFAALGVRVVMLDKWLRPLGFLEQELVDVFLARFAANGGQFLGARDVVSADWDGVSAVNIQLSDGERIQADKALVAMGRAANLEALGIEQAGLKVSERGFLEVNEFCQTAVPHVYAVGDTAGPPALASASMEQGRRAICHALGGARSVVPGLIPSGIYTIPEIATVGLTEQEVIARRGGAVVGRARYGQLARAHIMASAEGMLKLVADECGERLLGVQVAGDGATELIHMGQLAIVGGMSVDVFVNSIFNFPTMAEAYRVAALQILQARRASQATAVRQSVGELIPQ